MKKLRFSIFGLLFFFFIYSTGNVYLLDLIGIRKVSELSCFVFFGIVLILRLFKTQKLCLNRLVLPVAFFLIALIYSFSLKAPNIAYFPFLILFSSAILIYYPDNAVKEMIFGTAICSFFLLLMVVFQHILYALQPWLFNLSFEDSFYVSGAGGTRHSKVSLLDWTQFGGSYLPHYNPIRFYSFLAEPQMAVYYFLTVFLSAASITIGKIRGIFIICGILSVSYFIRTMYGISGLILGMLLFLNLILINRAKKYLIKSIFILIFALFSFGYILVLRDSQLHNAIFDKLYSLDLDTSFASFFSRTNLKFTIEETTSMREKIYLSHSFFDYSARFFTFPLTIVIASLLFFYILKKIFDMKPKKISSLFILACLIAILFNTMFFSYYGMSGMIVLMLLSGLSFSFQSEDHKIC